MRLLLVCLVPLLCSGLRAAPTAPAAPGWRFDFGPGPVAAGYTAVPSSQPFTVETGFGFEPGANITGIVHEGGDPLRADGLRAVQPSRFSVAAPEGTYLVTVTFGDASAATNLTVKAEARRLMVEAATTAPGAYASRTFAVHVRNRRLPPPPLNAPGGTEVLTNDRERGSPTWDDKLTLEFGGPAANVCAVEIVPAPNLPTVFLAGDSTVTDQPSEPGASWGQMLTRFLQPGVVVANYAESGETLKSFSSELRLAKLLSQMKAGDWLFIQFGHNDEKQQWPQTYVEAHTTYKAWLKVYISEARRRGATPVLVTSMQRRTFDAAGRIKNTHGDYPQAVREVAQEENVAVIDLDRDSVRLYEALGPERSPQAFSAGGRDATHHNNYGAYQLAKCVAQGIRAAQLPLAAFIVEDFASYDPAHPDPLETFAVPPSAGHSDIAPRGN
ncbi:rhamnogalacturonan acetylesterase [Opitutus sp. ER46]|uniref:rhamnogalacturonan acetylesterase n=1 Tax=Opitutus sp. ER46 TaxID=2161864 RepID=UPI000D3002E5|nr:rhamnogalacturonan acetylesterase [Opitutus sp. ER46]PTX95613.1 rhamnogalacturonan acetylesterase [Opitutus sp. ER46]